MMSTVSVFVAVGSNLDPERHVPAALRRLHQTPKVRITGVSTHYRTPPLRGRLDQPDYLNGVWRLETSLPLTTMDALLDRLEGREGRTRSGDSYEARTLDLDILIWGTLVDDTEGIPDEDVLERAFLFRPLLELEPGLRWPPTGRPLCQLVPPSVSEADLMVDREMTAMLKGMVHG